MFDDTLDRLRRHRDFVNAAIEALESARDPDNLGATTEGLFTNLPRRGPGRPRGSTKGARVTNRPRIGFNRPGYWTPERRAEQGRKMRKLIREGRIPHIKRT